MRREEIGAGSRIERDVRSGDSSEILRGIREPGVLLCSWKRSLAPELERFLGEVAASEPFAVETWGTPESLRLDRLLSEFPWSVDAARREWAADLHTLIDLFCDLRPEPREHPVHLKLGVSERIECPVFHSDWVSLRLICTYSGRGTQYVLDRGVDRGALCCPLETAAQTNAAIIRDASAIRRMAPFEVGLFKGNAYPGQEGRGVVHRSPHPGSARRLKLIIDSTEPMS